MLSIGQPRLNNDQACKLFLQSNGQLLIFYRHFRRQCGKLCRKLFYSLAVGRNSDEKGGFICMGTTEGRGNRRWFHGVSNMFGWSTDLYDIGMGTQKELFAGVFVVWSTNS